jgi:hypothetical protein
MPSILVMVFTNVDYFCITSVVTKNIPTVNPVFLLSEKEVL